jgi:F-type H+-transporting ATPase subunit b
MLGNEYTWITLALIGVLGLALWKGLRPILDSLDKRGERIRRELDEAHALREEAQKLLAEYKRKQRDALLEAEEIMTHAKEESIRMRERAEADLREALARREQLAMDKITQAEAQALQEVRNRAVDAALNAAGELIVENLDEKRAAEIADQAISEVGSKLG